MTRGQMYLILFFAFVGCCSAYPHKKPYVVTYNGDGENRELLGSKMCTRGSSYWCHNITQAAECHAMKHCIKTYWENPTEKLPEDNDSVCKVCLDMVQQARDQLLSNETQDELRQVLEGSCNLIPIKIVSKECDELADDFIPELIDALTSRMDPQMVCHISGLCNSVRIDEMLGEMKEIDGSGNKKVKPLDPLKFDTCPECEYYIGEYESTLKRLTKTDLRNQLLRICGYLGSYSDSCRGAVNHELDAIYNYIQDNMKPKDICGLIGLCTESPLHHVILSGGGQQTPTTNVRVWTPSRNKDDDLECDFCKQLTESVRQWLVGNNTEEEFQQVLQGLCKQTGQFKQECLSLVEQYGKQVYDTLVNGINPNELCSTIGVCPSGIHKLQLTKDNSGPIWTILAVNKDTDSDSSSEEDDSMPMMKLLPAEHLVGDDERNSLKTKENLECEFCQYALHDLQEYLYNAKTEEEIRAKVETFCEERLPSSFTEQCKTFVDEYGDALVTLLAGEVDPGQICPRLRLCPQPTTPTPKVEVRAVGQPVKDFLPTCALCSFTIEKLIDLVGKNMTKESIDKAMESVCTHLPQRMENNCMSFMKNYGDQVAEMILIYGTSHGVCAALHLCFLQPAPPTPSKIIVESQLPLDRYLPHTVTLGRVAQMETVEKDSRKCVMCEFVITSLEQRLQDNATEEEIKDEVEHICTYLPQTVSGKCKSFVDLYGEEIIQYLSQEIDPAEICQRLNLCEHQKKDSQAIRNLTMDRCQLCMLISDYLSTLVEEEKTDVKIDELAKKTCDLIPKSYRQECTALIEDYGAYLLNILDQETDKGKACAQIQVCPKLDKPTIVEDNSVDSFEY